MYNGFAKGMIEKDCINKVDLAPPTRIRILYVHTKITPYTSWVYVAKWIWCSIWKYYVFPYVLDAQCNYHHIHLQYLDKNIVFSNWTSNSLGHIYPRCIWCNFCVYVQNPNSFCGAKLTLLMWSFSTIDLGKLLYFQNRLSILQESIKAPSIILLTWLLKTKAQDFSNVSNVIHVETQLRLNVC